jgi:hypothetical protein
MEECEDEMDLGCAMDFSLGGGMEMDYARSAMEANYDDLKQIRQ